MKLESLIIKSKEMKNYANDRNTGTVICACNLLDDNEKATQE